MGKRPGAGWTGSRDTLNERLVRVERISYSRVNDTYGRVDTFILNSGVSALFSTNNVYYSEGYTEVDFDCCSVDLD